MVTVTSSSGEVRITVEDTGIGFDASFAEHLFGEFMQESSGLSRSHEGVGLGLAITKRLVDLLGGSITAESVKRKGSVFTVSFPIAAHAGSSPVPASQDLGDDVGSASEPASVLIVEDNFEAGVLMKHLMEDFGDVVLARNGEAALDAARQQEFDLILMDINLGDGPNGVDVMQRLRAMPRYAETPIIAVTAYALPGDRSQYLNLGFDAYLSKPFPPEGLRSLSAELLS